MDAADRPLDVVCPPTFAGLHAALAEAGFRVAVAKTPLPDLADIDGRPTCFVLLDADVAERDLMTAVRQFAAEPGVIAVVVGRDIQPDRIVAAMRAGAADYVTSDAEGRYLTHLPRRLRELAATADMQTRQALAQRFAQLMAAVQHDVKNPINNILGYVELLTENPGTKLSGDQTHFLQRIAANCTLVLEILENFKRETASITAPEGDG